jgi:hypothetical protein
MPWAWREYAAKDKRGISALALMGHIDVSYPTGCLMLHKIRAAMSHRDGKYQLSGFIQLDEAFSGGPNGKQGRGTGKATAYVAVSTAEDGKPLYAKALVVDRINKETAVDFARYLLPGCAVITDGLNVYPRLKGQGYAHKAVPSSSSEAERALQWANTVVSNAKAFISGTYHGPMKKHLQSYLNEYLYRFNRRWWQPELFDRLLSACITGPIVTYADLTL